MRFHHQTKDLLVAQRRVLLDRYLAELDRADEELEACDIDPVGHAADEYDAKLLLQLGDADARALGELVAAIKRFDAGSYGRCVTCFREIGTKRLEAVPAVALCFACAAQAESPVLR